MSLDVVDMEGVGGSSITGLFSIAYSFVAGVLEQGWLRDGRLTPTPTDQDMHRKEAVCPSGTGRGSAFRKKLPDLALSDDNRRRVS
jgi:hypothetical protein